MTEYEKIDFNQEKALIAQQNRDINMPWFFSICEKLKDELGNEKLDLHQQITATYHDNFVCFTYHGKTKTCMVVETGKFPQEFKSECDQSYLNLQRMRLIERNPHKYGKMTQATNKTTNRPITQSRGIYVDAEFESW